jgi:hypothetical protein
MNDLFSKALTALPAYISQVLGLLSGPKAFVLGRDLETAESATEAYTFLAITLFLSLIAQVSILPEQKDYLLSFASLAVIGAFGLILMSAALYFTWRIVGGTLSFKLFFIASCYFSGISTLLLVVFTLIGSGLLKYTDPDALTRLLHGGQPADPTSFGYVGFGLIVCVGLIAVYVWIVVVWGAYRILNNVSRERSAVALTLFTVLSPVLIGFQLLMQANLTPAEDRATSGRLPLDMVGSWRSGPAPGSEGAPFTWIIAYSFFPGGDYYRRITYTARQGGCAKTRVEDSNGHASIDGSTLVLVPRDNRKSESNSCSAEESESRLDLVKEIYPFELGHLPAGWKLCLLARLGQQCFSPI